MTVPSDCNMLSYSLFHLKERSAVSELFNPQVILSILLLFYQSLKIKLSLKFLLERQRSKLFLIC